VSVNALHYRPFHLYDYIKLKAEHHNQSMKNMAQGTENSYSLFLELLYY